MLLHPVFFWWGMVIESNSLNARLRGSLARDGLTERNNYFLSLNAKGNVNESTIPSFNVEPASIGCKIRTHSSATVRWTVAATSSKTGGYLNFCPHGKNANRIHHPPPEKNPHLSTTSVGSFQLSVPCGT